MADYGIKFVPASVQLLEQRLTHADPGVRNPAATKIPTLEAPEAPLVECLEKLITHENWFVQQAVVLSAGHVSDSDNGIAVTAKLAPFLEHDDSAVRRHASWALLNVIDHSKAAAVADEHSKLPEAPQESIPGDSVAAQLLCAPHREALAAAEAVADRFKSKNPAVQEKAVQMLYTSQEAAKLAAQEVAARFTHESSYVRQNAVKALARMGDMATPHSVALGKRIRDPVISVRNEVIRTVKALGVLVADGAGALGEGLAHEDPVFRRAAKRAIYALWEAEHERLAAVKEEAEAAKAKVTELEASKKEAKKIEPPPKAREEIERILTKIENAKVVVEKAEALVAEVAAAEVKAGADTAAGAALQLQSENPVTRLAALDCLAELKHLAAPHGPEMAQLLEDEDVTVRSTAVHALICAGQNMQPHLKAIKKRCRHSERDVQRAAVAALRGLACVCPNYARSAEHDLQEETEVHPRRQALEVLAGAAANVEPYLPDIVLCLEDNDWAIRRQTIETLADLKEHGRKAAGEVARRLTHHDRNVRRCAAEALGRMGKHSGDYGHRVEDLAATEEDEDVKRTAVEACELLHRALQAYDGPPAGFF
mmetsp:Transcript_79308/g.137507  ORF Transcript_79308/g.137507 Transcript_79308/m.137507 type:complete len:597 (-) Transcript_79308:18-1808(-)